MIFDGARPVPRWWLRPEEDWEHRLIEVVVALNDVRTGRRSRLWSKAVPLDRVLEAIIALCSSWLKMREWKGETK